MGLDVTVAVVPRERWSEARRSLDSVLRAVPAGTPLVYVDGGAPPHVADSLARRVRERGGTYLRRERYFVPNEARNRTVPLLSTRWVLWCDNDVAIAPGSVEALVRCGEETGAAVVGPVYLEGPIEAGVVHTAGGEASVVGEPGQRRLVERQRHARRPLAEVSPSLRREETGLAEFHGMLVSTDVLARVGPLDEGVMSFGEHPDFCLRVRAAGGSVWFEPAARLAYVAPPPVHPADVAYFTMRWSEAWNRATAARLKDVYGLAPDDPFLAHNLKFAARHRRLWVDALPGVALLAKGMRRRVRAGIDALCAPWLEHAARRRDGVRTRPFASPSVPTAAPARAPSPAPLPSSRAERTASCPEPLGVS